MSQSAGMNLAALFVIGLVALFIASLFLRQCFKFYQPILKRLGQITIGESFRPFSPNWITIQGLFITIGGFAIFVWWDAWWGIAISAFGAALDRLDGKMAYAMGQQLTPPSEWKTDAERNALATVKRASGDEVIIIPDSTNRLWLFWFEFNFSGTTDLGKVLDPFADKLKSTAMLAYFGWWTDVLNPWLVALMIAPEVFGTLMRRPFTFLRDWIYDSKASIVGKLKALTQWVVIALCLPFHMGYCAAGGWCELFMIVPNAILALSVLFAVLSVLSRMIFVQRYTWLKRIITMFQRAASHD